MNDFDKHKAENLKQGSYLDGTPAYGGVNLNWRERILDALREGRPTTMITFGNTQYMVTLQPYEPGLPLGAHKRDICGNCGQIVVLPLQKDGTGRWYHREAEYGNHAAVPLYHQLVDGQWRVIDKEAAPAAHTVQTPWAGPRCTICNRTIAFNGADWIHTENTYLDHDATAAEGAGPKIATSKVEPPVGARDLCKDCGKGIVYVGPFWQHEGLLSPRHTAVPKGLWADTAGKR